MEFLCVNHLQSQSSTSIPLGVLSVSGNASRRPLQSQTSLACHNIARSPKSNHFLDDQKLETRNPAAANAPTMPNVVASVVSAGCNRPHESTQAHSNSWVGTGAGRCRLSGLGAGSAARFSCCWSQLQITSSQSHNWLMYIQPSRQVVCTTNRSHEVASAARPHLQTEHTTILETGATTLPTGAGLLGAGEASEVAFESRFLKIPAKSAPINQLNIQANRC